MGRSQRGYHVTHHASFLELLRWGSRGNDIFVTLVPSPTRNSWQSHNSHLGEQMLGPHSLIFFLSKPVSCPNFRKGYESVLEIRGLVRLVSSFDCQVGRQLHKGACCP